MKMRAWRMIAPIVALTVLLTACGGGGSGDSGQSPAPPQSLGLMKITVSGLGTNNPTSHAELISGGGSGPQPHTINTMSAGIDVKQISATSVDVGTRGAGGVRYFNAIYSVRNAHFCGNPGQCPVYSTAHQNITFVAADTSSNIAGTAVTQLNRLDGTVDTASIAPELLPTHGVILDGPGTGVVVQPGYESLQIYTEAEIAAIPLDPGATGLFPYGYVVKNVNTSSSRTLPANPPAGTFDGQLAFSFKVPLQVAQADDPNSVIFIFQVVEDTNTRVTQSAEEQAPVGDITATARAATLGSTDLVVLGGRVAQTNIADPICTVRTAGTTASPTAFLANNGNTGTLAGAPYNLQFLPGSGAINGGFCTEMNDAGFGKLVVSGSQSGTRTAAGTYTGSYAGGGTNQLSFTPDAAHPFFPGELVSFSYTFGLTSFADGQPLTSTFVGSFLVKSPTASTGTFAAPSNVGVGTAPSSIAIGDFDRDGKLDMAVADGLDNTVRILPNSGAVVPTLVVGSNVNGGASAIVTADFNGDGKLDLAVVDQGNNKVAIFTGDGLGGFTGPVTINVGSSPEAIVVGDFNNDGKPDLAVVNNGGNSVSILTNNGSSGFTVTSTLTVGTSPFAVATGDFNGDGKLDLAVANGGDGTVLILFGTGAGGFNNGGTFSAGAGSDPDSIAVGDFDGDGILDLAVGDDNNAQVVIMTGKGDGTFPQRTAYIVGDTSFANPFYVTAGDFNGDGKLDLAIADNGDGEVSVLLNDGSGGFLKRTNYLTGSGGGSSFPNSVNAGDMNGDGRLDLVVTNFAESTISILSGKP